MSILTFGLGQSGGGAGLDEVRFGQITDALLYERMLDASLELPEPPEAELYSPAIEAELEKPYLDAELDDNC
jgi:hypothetical protein